MIKIQNDKSKVIIKSGQIYNGVILRMDCTYTTKTTTSTITVIVTTVATLQVAVDAAVDSCCY
jgi:hypothetical protein